jgi:superfamily II DNA or RNA helicase
VQLRPYQQRALDGQNGTWPGIRASLAEPPHSALLVLPTGTGKTVVFADLIAERVHRGERVLVLAHRDELIRQAAQKIHDRLAAVHWPSVGIEKAAERSCGEDVVVASVQTLKGARLAGFAPDAFGLVVVDEAHHAAAETYRAVLGHFAGAHKLGVTATPDRHDGAALGKLFSTVAYAYELREAIEDGWLSPLSVYLVEIESLDLSGVHVHHGDLDEQELGSQMEAPSVVAGVVKVGLEQCAGRPTLVFAATVRHAELLAANLNDAAPESAQVVLGTTAAEERRGALRAFAEGRLRFLVNVGVLTEGVDIPCIQAIIMARPTQSRSLYAQMAGRGTRLFPGKRDCLLLDITGNAGRHRLVCGLDILDGGESEPVRKRALRRAKLEPVDIMDALAFAGREEASEQLQRDLHLRPVRFRLTRVEDQLLLAGVTPRPGRWGGAMATDRQRELLEKWGVKGTEKMERATASDMITALVKRREAGLCTLKQAALLAQKKVNPQISYDRAREVLDAIAANDWHRPAWVKEAPDLQVPEGRPDGRRQDGVA